MSFSFKKFVELVDQEEVTEEQINELFGIFAAGGDKQAEIAKKRADEFKARRDALKKKAAGIPDDEEEKPKRQIKPIQTRPGPATSARTNSLAATGRAAERDWVANMEAADPLSTLKRLAKKHALETINSGDDKTSVKKIEEKIKALPNGDAVLKIVRRATNKWVDYAEEAAGPFADSAQPVSKEDLKKVDAILQKAYDLVKPVK